MRDVAIAIVSSLLGTVVGWLLNTINNHFGKIKISFENVIDSFTYDEILQTADKSSKIPTVRVVGKQPNSITCEFEIIVFNNKYITSGINNCKVYLEYGDGIKVKFGQLFHADSDVNEFEKLLNIESKTAKKVRYNESLTFLGTSENLKKLRNGYKIYLEYYINGRTKPCKPLIIKEEKIMNF